MGGGGAMRNAMKVAAGLGVGNGGFRGPPFSAASGQSAMKPSRPASAAMSSSSATKPAAADVAAPLHTASASSWDADDWEFAEDASELVMEAGEPMPRVVFHGAVPSFQEAKDATIELKEAIDQIYLSSSSSNKYEVSSDGSRVSAQSPHSELETKSCESELMPKHALQAFQYLSASSEAQTVVASIVSDPNVWSAMMQNSMLNDFLHSQEKVAGFEPNKSSVKLEEMPDSDETSSQTNGFFHSFNGFMQNVKRSVAEMLSGASIYLHNLFGFLSPEKMGSDDAEKPNNIFSDPATLAGTFFGLAVVVAMVVLFKRV